MAFEVPHKHDISLDGQDMRNQMIENFEAIEQKFDDLQGEIDSEEQDRKSEDNKLNVRIDDTNTRLANLDKQKATHDDVEGLRKDLQSRINHLYAGDPQTIKAVVTEILEEKGVI